MELSSIVQSKETGGKRVRHSTLNVEGSRYYQKIRAEAKAVEAADNKKKLGISVDEEGDYEEEEKGAISEEKDNQIDALQKHYSNSPICREQLQRLQRTLFSPKPASAPLLTNPAGTQEARIRVEAEGGLPSTRCSCQREWTASQIRREADWRCRKRARVPSLLGDCP